VPQQIEIYMQDSLYDKTEGMLAIYAGVKFIKKRNNKISGAAAKGSLANIYLAQNNYKEAKKDLKEIDLIQHDKSDRALHY
jgi:Tfp pilus assembly protein PilF